MTKIVPIQVEDVDIHPPPYVVSLGSIYDSKHTIWTKFRFLYDKYKKLFNIGIVVILIGIIILISTLTNFEKTDNPCIDYFPEDLANQISFTCFKYMWDKTCKTSIPENFDGGWWLRSPNGGKMIPCRLENKGSRCGAGSFKIITTYIYKCNLYYEGN
jgi:hypothetical protein